MRPNKVETVLSAVAYSLVPHETFEGENFHVSVQNKNFAEKTFADGSEATKNVSTIR